MKREKSFFGELFNHNETYLALVLIVFSMAVTAVNPVFFTLDNFADLVKNSTGTAILAIGVFIVLLSGGTDVSCTAVAISAEYIAARFLIATGINNIFAAFSIAIAVGIILGAVNAVFVSIFKIPVLIATLGTSSLFHGALLQFVGTKSLNVGDLPQCFKDFGNLNIIQWRLPDGTPYGLSVFFAILLALLLLTWFILRFTMIGRGIYALGGNPEAAKRTGFNLHKIQFFIYCYAGFLAGIMGIIHISLINYGNPMYLVGTELIVIAAVVLGGTRITGGTGTLTGTMLGVAMIMILQKNLVLIGLSSYWQDFFVGLIIVIGVTITNVQNKIKIRKKSGPALGV
ncbi:MAG: ABC transporter permease [Treponema sp.]|jgi:simple sugar transport system permease protein|nr:ABC transporter permease [Treponema sp.]